MSAAVVVPINESSLEQRQHQNISAANAVQILDQASFEMAGQMCLGLASLRREIVAHHADSKAKAHAAWRAVCDAENRLREPVEAAEEIIKSKIGAYELQQRRLQKQAEREAREAAELVMAEQMEVHIEHLEATGADADEIKAVIAQPVAFARPVIAQSIHKVSGISTRSTYKAEVTNIRELARAVADGKVPSTYLIPNEPALNAAARAQGPELSRFVPGVRAIQVSSVAARQK